MYVRPGYEEAWHLQEHGDLNTKRKWDRKTHGVLEIYGGARHAILNPSEILKQGELLYQGKLSNFNATPASQMMIFRCFESANVIGILHAIVRHLFEFKKEGIERKRESVIDSVNLQPSETMNSHPTWVLNVHGKPQAEKRRTRQHFMHPVVKKRDIGSKVKRRTDVGRSVTNASF